MMEGEGKSRGKKEEVKDNEKGSQIYWVSFTKAQKCTSQHQWTQVELSMEFRIFVKQLPPCVT